MKIDIIVTQADINAKGRGVHLCPNALALCRAFPSWKPNVGQKKVSFCPSNRPNHNSSDDLFVELPEIVQQWITAYDRHRDVEPITYQVEFPEGVTL